MGFAPNPYWGVCTLAYCKPDIRKGACIGDRIIGTGSAGANLEAHLIFWMRVDEIMRFDDYWKDARFTRKRPVLNGSKMQQFGDNIYYTDPDGRVRQLDSFHSEPDGVLSVGNMETDIGKTDRVLIGYEFAYFGRDAPPIPDRLRYFVKKGVGRKNKFSPAQQAEMDEWLLGMPARGVIGEPVRW
jgi:hypothetical protein